MTHDQTPTPPLRRAVQGAPPLPQARKPARKRVREAYPAVAPDPGPRATASPASRGGGLTRREALIGAAMAGRWLAAAVALAGGALITIAANDLADHAEPWMSLRRSLHFAGYSIVILSLSWLVLGALLQTPSAVVLGGRIRDGWLVVAALVAHLVLVAFLAVPIAAVSPQPDPAVSSKSDPADHYPTSLCMMLIGFSLFVVSGTPFVRWKDPELQGPGMTVFLMIFIGGVGWFGGLLISFSQILDAIF
jgi:hypothetical protein